MLSHHSLTKTLSELSTNTAIKRVMVDDIRKKIKTEQDS